MVDPTGCVEQLEPLLPVAGGLEAGQLPDVAEQIFDERIRLGLALALVRLLVERLASATDDGPQPHQMPQHELVSQLVGQLVAGLARSPKQVVVVVVVAVDGSQRADPSQRLGGAR